jgi:site-specific DNA recombinase
MEQKPQKKRCAIYTRKSVDDGLEQEFNSLDAQREAGEAYVTSQKANGWVCLPDHFDDGGFSGGNTSRPALKRLLAECRAGNIDVVLVYKIDRLSRSICDFAELTKFFDQYNVSFCSVTQDINTSTSSGRMMLNILMTFAQYEREIIGERIRDKFAASKRKGMWMGGAVPLGYRVQDRKLVVVEEEAETVRNIYRRYLEIQSPKGIAFELNAKGLKTKRGRPWNKGNLHHILRNCIYIGKVSHKGEIYDGEQQAIVDKETWETVQNFMDTNPAKTDLTRKSEYVSALKGVLYCGHCGGMMTATTTTRTNGKRYTYYKCSRDSRRAVSACPVKQVGATMLEDAVFAQMSAVFRTPLMAASLAGLNGIDAGGLADVLGRPFWNEATSVEKHRLVELLVERIRLYEDKMDLELKAEGIMAFKEEIDHENRND